MPYTSHWATSRIWAPCSGLQKMFPALFYLEKKKLFQATGENIDMSNPTFLWSRFSPGLFDLLPQLIGVDISDS